MWIFLKNLFFPQINANKKTKYTVREQRKEREKNILFLIVCVFCVVRGLTFLTFRLFTKNSKHHFHKTFHRFFIGAAFYIVTDMRIKLAFIDQLLIYSLWV